VYPTQLKKPRETNRTSTGTGSNPEGPTIVSVSSAGTTVYAENPPVSKPTVPTLKQMPIRPKNYVAVEGPRLVDANFERWLGGVNERMNSWMYFELKDPEPLIYYLPQVSLRSYENISQSTFFVTVSVILLLIALLGLTGALRVPERSHNFCVSGKETCTKSKYHYLQTR
jgi:hypothetical protein